MVELICFEYLIFNVVYLHFNIARNYSTKICQYFYNQLNLSIIKLTNLVPQLKPKNMKKRIIYVASLLMLFISFTANAQNKPAADKSKRPSPPAKVTETLSNGTVVSLDYSQPSLKGRVIGKDLAVYGKLWRTGANEATVFEISKDVKINGKALAAGKYGLFTIPGENEWTIIFNKIWDKWGETDYTEAEDALRIVVKPSTTTLATEKMTFEIEKSGEVSLMWGNTEVSFKVK